ncbi:hypothetical protein HaloA020_33580 [Halomonas sp. A020]|nr:hypothetical protein HaloA020_33580 [Halomonas sp. A020]
MFYFDKDQRVAVVHHQVQFTALYMVIAGHELEATLLQPLSRYLLNGCAA